MYEHGSHPVWVRGLKLNQLRKKTVYVVAPRVGAWIETRVTSELVKFSGSHPVWVRGLKLEHQVPSLADTLSHPVWVRGLKQLVLLVLDRLIDVAPRVGAWIETHNLK